MDHDYIEQSDLVGRYLRRSLTPEEGEQFEEHFVDCPQCIDRLKTTREFKQGLRLLTAEQLSQGGGKTAKGFRWLFLERISWKPLTIAATCLLVVAVLGLIFLASRVRDLESESAQAKNSTTELQRLYEEQQQATLSAEQQREEIERNLRGQVSQLEAELRDEQQERADNSGLPRAWSQPAINVLTFVLTSVRGKSQDAVTEIKLSRSPVDFFIFVPLEGETRYKTYRVTILAGDRRVWASDNAKPNSDNLLTIGFNSSFFQPSDYLLTVEGIPRDTGTGIIGSYPFRVTK